MPFLAVQKPYSSHGPETALEGGMSGPWKQSLDDRNDCVAVSSRDVISEMRRDRLDHMRSLGETAPQRGLHMDRVHEKMSDFFLLLPS